jgi:hypothetical protein
VRRVFLGLPQLVKRFKNHTPYIDQHNCGWWKKVGVSIAYCLAISGTPFVIKHYVKVNMTNTPRISAIDSWSQATRGWFAVMTAQTELLDLLASKRDQTHGSIDFPFTLHNSQPVLRKYLPGRCLTFDVLRCNEFIDVLVMKGQIEPTITWYIHVYPINWRFNWMENHLDN